MTAKQKRKFVTSNGLQYNGKYKEEEFKIKTDMSSKLLWQKIKDQGDSAEATAIKQASQNIVKAFK